MRLKPKFWLLLSLLFFTAGLCLWQAGDRLAAARHALAVAPVSSLASLPSHPSAAAAPAAAAPAAVPPGHASYHLSNTPQSAAELARNPRAILLRNASIDTARPVRLAIPAALRAQGPPGSYLVQSDRPLNAEFYAALRRDGAEFVSYIPNNCALVQATAGAAQVMLADGVFQAVLPYEPYFKLGSSLLAQAVNGELLTNNIFRVTVFHGQEAAAAQGLAALGAVVAGGEPSPFGTTTLRVTVPPDRLAAVAQLPQAQEIEAFSPRHLLNDLTRVRLGVSTNTIALTNYLGLTGSNMWVVLDDTGVDRTHPDFGPGRVAADVATTLTDTNGHGTHVAGTIMGGGNQSGLVTSPVPGSTTRALYSGMAPQASVYAQGVDLWSGPYVSDVYLQSNASFVLTAMAATNRAMVTNGFINNLSWGYQDTSYDLAAASYDLATRNAQPGMPGEHAMLFVVAAGDGAQSPGSITSPATAKNVIAVGAVDSPRFITNTVDITNQGITDYPIFQSMTSDSNQVADFSSGGNVGVGQESAGGRFKPDVVAPGAFTVSTRSTNYQDPTEQQVSTYYLNLAGESVGPGQSNVYSIFIAGGTTNLVIQVLPNAFSPVPFPGNLQIYFDSNYPPRASTLLPASQTNEAGLPVVLNPMATNYYLEILSPGNQPWPVAYDLRAYGIATNDFGTYYTVLSNLNSALSPWYRYESGTSMAAGAVSGMLALMQEYLLTITNASPSPALLKALLLNGARPLNRQSDLNMAPPVNREGWGLPNLANSIPVSLNPANPNPSMVYFDQSPTNVLQTGQWHTYTNINSTDANFGNYPLRITLVWTDPPGNPAAGLALVNDLDLVVTDVTGTNVYIGNDFLAGDIYTEVSPSTNLAASDTVNNVESVYIDASYGLLPPYTVSVRGTRVNVNAATAQTNVIGQDYALVIASDDPALTAPLTVTDLGTVTNPPSPLVTVANNGTVLLHQRVGANEPNLAEYPGGGLYYPGYTNGSLVQWHFFVVTNVNHTATNTVLFSNNAVFYTNIFFATFVPATLTIPNAAPVNLSYQAANNADLDLYVSTNPLVVNNNFDPNVLAAAGKSLGRGGEETVLMTNIAEVPVFYVGVKSETQQGGDFAFFTALTTNFDTDNGDGSFTANGFPLPQVIPDSFDTGGLEGADVFAIIPQAIAVRKVLVTAGVEHSNPADLIGTFYHNGQQVVLNHFTGAPGGFTNLYDDLPDGENLDALAQLSDGPGTLQTFIGQDGSGQWRLNQRDNAFTQTGMVTVLSVTVWPQPINPLDFIINLPPHGSYYGYVDVPDDATNLNIAVTNLQSGTGPVGIYLTNHPVANNGDYGTNPVNPPGGSLNLSTFPPPLPPDPLLSGGRWYYDITNDSSTALSFLQVIITISTNGTPNLILTEFNNTLTPLGTDDHTQSQICINGGVLTNNQQLVALQVGVRIAKTNADNLVLHLISPQGNSVLLYEDRGGPGVTNLGLTTNGNYIYLNFTEDTDLAQQFIKFYPPPFGQLGSNEAVYASGFETVAEGDYGVSNAFITNVLGTNFEGWTVVSNDVAVVTGSDLYLPYLGLGSNYLALANGVMTNLIPTVIGQPYALTYAYRGPGLVDWWPMEDYTNIIDVVGTNNGTLTAASPLTNVTGQVGQGIQFPSSSANPDGATINFGTNAGNFGTNDFTIDYWMNTISGNPTEAFLEKRRTCDDGTPFWGIRIGAGTVVLELGPGGTVQPYPAPLSLAATHPLNDGLWHHIAWVRKGMDHYIYIDGALDNHLNNGILNNVGNNVPVIMGTSVCEGHDSTVPYTGAVDELDLWNRALTDVEIAAIYQAGANHLSKADTTSILPNCEILLNGLTNTTLVAPASSTNWLTNTVYFTAVNSNTAFALQGHALGMLFDDFVLQTPVNPNYVLPEESLAPFTGQNPYGCWTLDVWDTRNDAPAPSNGVLLSWNLQMTVSATNVNLIVLTNHVPYTAGSVALNDIAYFAFDVPPGANFDTNTLTNFGGTDLTLLFNQTALPTGNNLGDYTLTNVPGLMNGSYTLTNNSPPPSLLPGARYFLGVQNTNNIAATFTIEVDTQIITNTTAIPLTNASVYTNTITNAPQFYSFDVPTNAILAAFEIINPTNELDLYARHALPLPSNTMFDYRTYYQGTNEEAIVVTTNSFDPVSHLQITTNSAPIPLTPGTWYLVVYNFNTNNSNTYRVVATYLTNTATNSPITITPLTNFVTNLYNLYGTNGAYATNGNIGPGPDLTNFYSYTVTNPAATAVQFVVSNMTGNVDLIVRNGALPTPQQMTDGSFNAQRIPEEITIVSNAVLPTLTNTTWYLGVPNNTAQLVSFTITATTLTNASPGYTTPAVVLTGMSAGAGGFTLNWTAVPGGQYEVRSSSDLVHWNNAAAITSSGYSATYTDPAPVSQQAARFYQIVRTQ